MRTRSRLLLAALLALSARTGHAAPIRIPLVAREGHSMFLAASLPGTNISSRVNLDNFQNVRAARLLTCLLDWH